MDSIRSCAGDPRLEPVAAQLIEAAAALCARGWMLGTSGSVSARLGRDPLQIAVTVSGKDKGQLSTADLLCVTDDGAVFDTLGDPRASSESLFAGVPRPSGETLVHEAVYRRFPEAGAVMHVHSVDNTLASFLVEPGARLPFGDLEMIKGLGRWQAGEVVSIPVVENLRDIPALARAVAAAADPEVPGVLVRGHGTYVWGPDVERARRHTEILEFLLSFEIKARMLGLAGL